ncbi:pyridoxamine 5'-phosphate oxidase [Kockovaella imperatae]|uniref:pyridoxal 5'-phosphate synthase n=1 Tax=Kockovaella imperatae TaxID=4999 RepID=A0A1Y1UFH6_9TREE|nr:pyridoxamine 5'-phosphate oxidase [Kockovaella imperatae]ORX36256.1 pyridoxamine 5'-phosphate oxidase [Kockovaella imperatae]
MASASEPGDSAPSSVNLRTHNQYVVPPLHRDQLNPNPFKQFNDWFTSALNPKEGEPVEKEPEAVIISTVSSEGIPSSRAVLLRTADERGFVIFTNYNSRKSQEISSTGYASLVFYWKALSRQVRVVGKVEKVSREESVEYHNTRPRGSQIAAWASEQSKEVEDGEVARRAEELGSKSGDDQIPCPEHWGGWRIVPFEMEFWVGQPSRLHDRFRYTRPRDVQSSEWNVARLAP